MSSERRDLQSLWPQEEGVVPIGQLAPGAAFTANGGQPGADGALRPRPTRPARLTAADFTPERMLRPTARPPAGGWRLTLYLLSGGRVAIPPGEAELRRQELAARIKTPISGCRKVAFVSRKGGVGKTTTCLLVGHAFASFRGDRVVALDANPDAGTLGHRLRRETMETVATLLRDRRAMAIGRYADVRAYTSQAASRLEVIAGDERCEITDTLGSADVGRAVALLERHFNLLCLDTAAGVLGPAAQGVLEVADQAVIVSAASLDSARAASATLDWLEEHGRCGMASSAVAVLNGIRDDSSGIDVGRIEEHFAARCRACIRIPWDPHLDTGADVALEQLRPGTRQALLELAAAIADGFTEPTQRRS
jgi:putative peptide zinc metalloprotease protein